MRLCEIFDRGLRSGVKSLSPTDRALFRIQDFIVEYEMNGLGGYFYNRLPELKGIRATVTAMRGFKLTKLADLLSEAAELFAGYTDPDPPCTWGEVLQRYDPSDKLENINRRILALEDYGLGESTIA